MASEVRKVLEREHEQWGEYSFFKEIANAERSDAAKREVSFIVECKRCGQSTCTSPEYSAVCGCGAVFKLHRHNQQADAAKREEPVQELRRKVAELVAQWKACSMPPLAASFVNELLADLNAIIATKLESQPATSEPSVTFGESPKATLPAGKPADEHIRAIAAMAVRDAMPDVIDKLACMFGEAGFSAVANAFRKHAAKLRKERGA